MTKVYSLAGMYMYNLVWFWRKGNKQIYTRKLCIAEKAMREGFFVMVLSKTPHIFKK